MFAIALVRSAWLSDDSFITLRTIDNFWRGYGLRWNIVERVQAYTHPLWMLLLGAAYGLTREAQLTTFAVSFLCTGGLIALLLRRLPIASAAIAILLLSASRAFVDYSTSGLENPLTHLILGAFWLRVLQRGESDAQEGRRLLPIALLASLAMLTRQDLALLVGPTVIVETVRESRRVSWRAALRALAAASIPLVAWHLFSLAYYGFLLPNTAYAKLAHGVPHALLLEQGQHYLGDSFRTDPATLIVIGAAFATMWVGRVTGRTALLAGVLLNVGYVVWVGGDFMSGRFLTPAFVTCALLLASRLPAAWPRVTPIAVAALLLVSVMTPGSPLRLTGPVPVYGGPTPSAYGIIDERAVYYPFTGLLPWWRGALLREHPWAASGAQAGRTASVQASGAIGLFGYVAGPQVHIIDLLGLSDALLARLPAQQDNWRIGHFWRRVPVGYPETQQRCLARRFPGGTLTPTADTCLSLWQDVTQIRDKRVAHSYHELMRITQGPLLAPARVWHIVRWNLGIGGVPVAAPPVAPPAGAAH